MAEQKNKKPQKIIDILKKISLSADLVKSYILKKRRREEGLLFLSILAVLVIAVFGIGFDFFSPKIEDSQIIKEVLVKNSQVVAGQPVEHTILVKLSQIKENQHLVQLPKGSKNITVKIVSTDQAEQILTQKPLKETTPQERQQLASIISSKPKSALTKLILSMFASLSDIVGRLTGALGDAIVGSDNRDIIQTSDAVFVNLSDQVVEQPTKQEQKEEKKEEKEERKESKKQILEEEQQSLEDVPAPAEQSAEQPVLEGLTPQELPDVGLLKEISPEDQPVPIVEVPLDDISLIETVSPSDQPVVEVLIEETPVEEAPVVEEILEEYVQIEYETPGPQITEQETDDGKLVTVSDSNTSLNQLQLTDVLAYANIPEIFKIGDEQKIKIKWQNNGNQEMQFSAFDLNNNGKLDYVEWTVPHLSEQIFEIIFISKAFELDQDKNIVADIYDQAVTQDNVWAVVPAGHYVRATFEQILDNTKDITLYIKPVNPGQSAAVEVYPVYTDANGNQAEGPQLALVSDGSNPDFSNLDKEGKYRVLLKNLQTPTDVFDLKIIGADVDIDWIVDPVTLYFNGNNNLMVWGEAGNWCTTVSCTCDPGGDASAPPGAGDTAIFPGPASGGCQYARPPILVGALSLANLIFESGSTGMDSANQAVTITGDLTVTDVSTGTFSTLIVGGTADLNGTAYVGTTTFDVNNIDMEANVTIAVASEMQVSGNFTSAYLNLDSIAGSIVFDGTGAQSITFGGGSAPSIEIDKASGTASLAADLALSAEQTLAFTKGTLDLAGYALYLGANFAPAPTAAAVLNINNGTFTDNEAGYNMTLSDADMTITQATGTVTVQDYSQTLGAHTISATLNARDFSHTGGTFTSSGTTAINASGNVVVTSAWTNTGSTITMSGTTKTINASQAINNLVISAGSTSILTNNLTVGGTLQLTGGSFDANTKTTGVTGLATISSGTYSASTATQTFDGGLTISGGTFTGSTGAVDVNGILTLSSGTLTAPSGSFTVSGNWVRSGGIFTPGANTVTFDGVNQTISGSNIFNSFSKTESTNDSTDSILTFDNTATQTIGGLLTLDGLDADDRINLVSDSPGTQWSLTANGTFAIDYVDVIDSDASGGLTIVHTNTVNSGNNSSNWGFNTAPTLTSISDSPDPIKGGSTITIAPTGQGDGESDALYYYCAESTAPTSVSTLCSQANTSYSTPYSSMTCTYGVSTGDATRTVYCRTYDNSLYSTERTTTYVVDTTAPTLTFSDDVASGPVGSDTITGSWGDASTKKWEYDADGVCSTTAGDYSKTDANSMDQSTQTNNGKYICLYGEDAVANKSTQVSANDINIDTTAPSNISISSVTPDSSTQITVLASTATDAGAELHSTPYFFTETIRSTDSGWQASATFIDTGLTPNTQYTYKVKAKDSLGNTSDYSSTSSKYTLANVPSSLAATADSSAQITATWTANSNPSGTEYYIENTTNSTNSGWITSLFWSSSGLSCGTSYSFKVKARNGDSVATDFSSSISVATSGCGGGGLPSGAYSTPSTPTGGFSVFINNNDLNTETQEVTLLLKAGSDTARMAISNNLEFTNAVQEIYQNTKQWILSEGDGNKTVYVKFFTSYGQSSGVYLDTIYLGKKAIVQQIGEVVDEITQLPGQVVDGVKNIVEGISETINPKQAPKIEFPPIEDVVKKETPFAFKKQTNVLPVKNIGTFVLGPMSRELSALAQKIPQLGKTFKDIGISKASDVSKLVGSNLVLPGLAETTNLAKVDVGPGGALPEGVLVGNLTDSAKMKIPTEIVFLRTGGGLVDQNVNLSIDEQGAPQQNVTVISNKSLQFIVKPDNPARAIRGYLLFKQKQPAVSIGITPELATASLIQVNIKEEPVKTEERLVVQEFNYLDPDKDGIWIADITSPVVDGEYEVLTVTDYLDQRLKPTQISLIVVVDPEGYIYYQKPEGQVRISGATVTLYWLNPETKLYEVWNAEKYRQTNPQTTDVTGRYSFLVPEGSYYLKVEARGYTAYYTKEFEVINGIGVHENIELKKSDGLAKYFDWKIIIILLMFAFLFYNFYRDRLRDKKINLGKKV